jgi:hypothetical protein
VDIHDSAFNVGFCLCRAHTSNFQLQRDGPRNQDIESIFFPFFDFSKGFEADFAVWRSTEEQVAQAEMLAWFAEILEKVRIGSASVTINMKSKSSSSCGR